MPNRRQVVSGIAVSSLAVPLSSHLAPARSVSAHGGLSVSQATPVTGTPAGGQPTVALVHGAFADSSGWQGVITALTAQGVRVVAIANPLRGISADAAYVASRLQAITGPVVLVGHSYGGAVITTAAASASNVSALVYVAAYAPDEGETLQGLGQQFTDSLLGAALVPVTVPVPGSTTETQMEFSVDPAQFHAAFAADLPEEMTAIMAVTQRPIADTAFGEPTTVAAWKTLPSWFAVSSADRAIDPAAERFMAQRAGSTTIEIDASHVGFISQPTAISDLIMMAVNSVA